jgi:serine/threonine protein kinase
LFLQLNGQFLSAELSRELETLQKIEHQNLVRFLGFLEQREETLIVVEYVDNGSLREHLDGMKLKFFSCSQTVLNFVSIFLIY